MLKKLGLYDHMWEESRPPAADLMEKEIDWKAVRGRLEMERSRSFQFIRDSLEKSGG